MRVLYFFFHDLLATVCGDFDGILKGLLYTRSYPRNDFENHTGHIISRYKLLLNTVREFHLLRQPYLSTVLF